MRSSPGEEAKCARGGRSKAGSVDEMGRRAGPRMVARDLANMLS
jgi:hypothetical protein